MQFQKGQSGNPNGRPSGAVNVRTKMLAALQAAGVSEDEFSAEVVELAKRGNTTALSLIGERLWSRPKQTLEPLPIEIDREAPLEQKAERILDAALAGEISADHAAALMAALSRVIEVTELPELIERIRKLEQR